jgi:hypothetical protein
MSEKLGRPFFFNSETNIGQWAIPPELTATEDLDAVIADGGKSAKTAGNGSAQQSANTPGAAAAGTKITNGKEKEKHRKGKGRHSNSPPLTASSPAIPCTQADDNNNNSDFHVPLSQFGDVESPQMFQHPEESPTKKAALAALQLAAIESETEDADHDISQCEYTNMSGQYIPMTQIASATQGGASSIIDVDDDDDEDADDLTQGASSTSFFLTQTQPPAPESSESERKWSCAVCTYLNDALEFSCEMCGTASGVRRSHRSSHDGFLSQGVTSSSLSSSSNSRPDAFSMMKSSSVSASASSQRSGSRSSMGSKGSAGKGGSGRHSSSR